MSTITIYSPDSHLAYDRTTLDEQGIGGGATTRVRMAYALARRGHKVRLYINCPMERSENGVETRHFSTLQEDRSEIFIATTSGSGLDLSPLNSIELHASIRILLVHGTLSPMGYDLHSFDSIYAPSNFIRRIAITDWGIPQEKIFVNHRGLWGKNFQGVQGKAVRDPFTLVYSGHPSKGLGPALAICKHLRAKDTRFSLRVYGGFELWGEEGRLITDPVISFQGILGQVELARRLHECSFSLNLQTRQEPFGMTIIEAMRAGCIVLASPVGAYPEIITDGKNGFLLPGDPASSETHEQAVYIIQRLLDDPKAADAVRQNARFTPLTCSQVARAWEGHWGWITDRIKSLELLIQDSCPECGGDCLALADGQHCIHCGNYQKANHRSR
jgi:glycosyltransferase involved in cell wall biosynthesis